MEKGPEVIARIDSQSGSQLGVSTGDAIWSFAQAFPVRVLANRDHDLSDGPLNAG